VKVWLDDERPAPKGWTRAFSVDEVRELLSRGGVEELSLDNDLGEGEPEGREVVRWLEELAFWGDFETVPDKISVHSANSVARADMEAGIRNIRKYSARESRSVAFPPWWRQKITDGV
jgi:hypothetical protein